MLKINRQIQVIITQKHIILNKYLTNFYKLFSFFWTYFYYNFYFLFYSKIILKKIISLALFSAIIISSFAIQTPVFAKNEIKLNQKNQEEIQKVLKNIQEKDPQKLTSQELKANKNDQNELISDQSENFQIKFSLKNKKVNKKVNLDYTILVEILCFLLLIFFGILADEKVKFERFAKSYFLDLF